MPNTWTGGWDELKGAFDTATGGVNRGLSSLVKGHGFDVFGIDPADRGDSSGSSSSDSSSDSSSSKSAPSGDAAEISKLQKELKTAQAGDKTAEAQDQYTQLADAQAQQFLGLTKSLDPLTSGATLPAIESTASANAAQMLGQSSTSPISQWLNQQTQAAQAQNAPVEAAEQQTAKAQDYSAQYLSGGLQNMGKAEDQLMAAAPYEQLLQSLAADVPYKILGGETLQTILPEVKTGEASLGLSTAGAPAASTPSLPPINAGIIPGAPGTVQTGPADLTG